MAIIAGVLNEDAPAEHRVALTPTVVPLLADKGVVIHLESGAGHDAGYSDQDYHDAGAEVTSRHTVATADILLSVRRPAADVLQLRATGQVLIGLLEPARDRDDLQALADRGVEVLPLESLPRQISRAQTMDALSSQASIAGYRAVLEAAHAYGRYLPMMVTAAGTAKPASVLVLGAGVAGLQAIATARRLGARVTGYDVRPEAREEITSLGAQFLDTGVSAVGDGGYARSLSDSEAAAQRDELAQAVARADILVTTARVPGSAPPRLVEADTVAAMRTGSVVVDLASGPWGGNVAGVVEGETTVTDAGVTLIGAGDLASAMAPAASDAYARNLVAVLGQIVADGAVNVDPDDDVIGAMRVRSAQEGDG